METKIIYDLALWLFCSVGFIVFLVHTKLNNNSVFLKGKQKEVPKKVQNIVTILAVAFFVSMEIASLNMLYKTSLDYLDYKNNSLQTIEKIVKVTSVSTTSVSKYGGSGGQICYVNLRDKNDKDCLEHIDVREGDIIHLWLSKRTKSIIQYSIIKR